MMCIRHLNLWTAGILVAFTLWINACDRSSSSHAEMLKYTTSLAAIDTIYIPIDERVAFNSGTRYYTFNETPYLYTYLKHKDQNVFIFYDLHKQDYSFEFSLDQQGPLGVGTSAYIPLVVNMDSIFFIRRHSNRLYLLDSSAHIKDRWQIEQTTTAKEIYRIHAERKMPMLFRHSTIYCGHRTGLLNERKEFYAEPLEVIISLALNDPSGYQAHLRGSYPDFLQQGIFKGGKVGHQVDRVLDARGNSIYSFGFDHHIYQTDDSLQRSYFLPSQYLEDDFPIPPKGIEDHLEMSIQYACENGLYFALIYDPFQKVYYRTVLHPRGPVSLSEVTISMLWDLAFSIQIISEDFKMLAEVTFPANTFNYFLPFIPTPQGLLLPYMHEQNPDLKEDRFAYIRYQLVDTKE